MITTKN